MSVLTESRKRDASALLADPDCHISKRMRYGLRLSPPQPPPPPPPPPPPTTNPSFSEPSVPDISSVNSKVIDNFQSDGEHSVEVFVKEMTRASDINDARNRAFRLLELFEKSVKERTASELTEKFQEEHNKLKEQMNSLLNENGILKKAVAIQHERLKENGEKIKELDGLKQTLSQYQEKTRILELNNYALAMHLRQAQGGPIQGDFNRHIF